MPAEILCRSCFSLLDGASQPEELVERANAIGLSGLGIADRDAVYGLVRAHRAAREARLPLVTGARVTVEGTPGLALLVRDREGWAHLCHLLTEGRRDRPKGTSRLALAAVLARARGLHAVLCGPWAPRDAATVREAFGEHASLAVSRDRLASDAAVLARAAGTAHRSGLPLVASADARMHAPERKRLLDVLTCIRRRTTLDRAGRALAPNAERYLRADVEALLLEIAPAAGIDPRAIRAAAARSEEILASCTFSLDELDYVYPREGVPAGHTPASWLRHLVEAGLQDRYRSGVPEAVRRQVAHELEIIEQLGFPAYFLTVYDAVAFARSSGILCQGRGSAANSAVCYALGITSVDPARSHLLFERFLSPERGEPPDIDVDFEHERREEVIRYLYEKYGRHRAAMVNEVVAWRYRSALRDVGKVLGLSLDQVDALARLADPWGRDPFGDEELVAAGLDPDDRRVRLTVELAGEIRHFPRHVGIHVGGFVLTDDDLTGRVPVEPATMEGRTVIQWDKDDIDAVGFVKVDLLSLGMLTAIRKAFDLVAHGPCGREPHGLPWAAEAPPTGVGPDVPASIAARPFTTPAGTPAAAGRPPYGVRWTLATVPAEDPEVYEMISKGDTTGVFQIESRAQMSMLPRLRPRSFYDLVIEVAIVRPGPIQGGMVHPYLRRRRGEEPVTYAHPDLEPILERTLGVPIFQEQVMAMAMTVAGFTAGEADQLRRSMSAWRRRGTLGPIAERLRAGLVARGLAGEYADQIERQIQGFAEYGFPESHAASFALLVYVSSWLKLRYPAAFTAALLNAQPMGFYTPRSLVADVRRHGVEVRPASVRASAWDCTLEPTISDGPAIRLGLRLVQGLGEEDARRIEAARAEAPFRSLPDLARRTRLDRGALSALAHADAFQALGLARREALWAVEGLWDTPLFAGLSRTDAGPGLPEATPEEEMQADFASTGLSLSHHPVGLRRDRLRQRGVLTAADLLAVEPGAVVRVAGLVSCRQRPGTASGVLFLTLEDETGQVNVIVWPRLYERHRRLLGIEPLLEIAGRLQREAEALSVVASSVRALPGVPAVEARSRDFR
ncbi:MAG: DNA polymerase III subunit alpha [Deltaproteobacteria bacterium]|nr:DNA polymerase III subunit alpha [Deltaproteobacteria bacterium]